MNSTTACGKADLSSTTLMASPSTRGSAERQRKQLRKTQAAAYALALLAHLALWQLYQALPAPPPPKEEPKIIEVALVASKPAPAAAVPAPQPPRPQVQPPPPKPKIQPKPQPQPKPKPLPKLEKPAAAKPERPKPKPQPEPRAEAAPAPAPEPAQEPVFEEAPPAPPVAAPHPKPAPKAEAKEDDEGEDNKYHKGGLKISSPRYHRLAQERGLEGTVRLKVHVLANGDIDEVIVIGGSGHEILDEYAQEMAKGASANPSRRGEKPIDEWFILPIQFKLQKP